MRWIAAAVFCITACNEPTADTLPRGITAATALPPTGVVATEVSPAPTVRVTDGDGAPVAGVNVNFSVVEGDGTVTPSVVRTDAAGLATATWTLGRVVAQNRLTASVSKLAPVEFAVAAAPGPVARIQAASGESQFGMPDSALAEPLTVYVADRFGNAVVGATVTFEVISGGGTIEHAIAVSDASGLATSGTWTLGGTVGVQKAQARAAGVEVVFTADASGTPPLNSSIIFIGGSDRQIYTATLGGAYLRRLSNSKGRNLGAAWSPDGRRIAFALADTSQRNPYGDYPADVYLMDADGTNVVRRTVGLDLRAVAWSPDGRKLAVSNEAAYDWGINNSAVWIISTDDDGSSPVHLASDARAPAWSPDGKKIAYVWNGGDMGVDAIVVINADGTDAARITPWDGGRYGVTWSPDGRRIASSICRTGWCDAYVMNADGSQERRLTDLGNVQGAAWSPDGNWIAVAQWTFWSPGSSSRVSYMSAEGGVPRVIASDGFAPSWHP